MKLLNVQKEKMSFKQLIFIIIYFFLLKKSNLNFFKFIFKKICYYIYIYFVLSLGVFKGVTKILAAVLIIGGTASFIFIRIFR